MRVEPWHLRSRTAAGFPQLTTTAPECGMRGGGAVTEPARRADGECVSVRCCLHTAKKNWETENKFPQNAL